MAAFLWVAMHAPEFFHLLRADCSCLPDLRWRVVRRTGSRSSVRLQCTATWPLLWLPLGSTPLLAAAAFCEEDFRMME
jgi:hypothetical protein